MTVTVVPVGTRAELKRFQDLPFHLYGGDRNWVAPLRSDERRRLDPARNPFFVHAEAAYFLAYRGGQVIGRISAHTDERYNEFHAGPAGPDRTGFWGFFECEEDPEAADALFDAAGAWLSERGKAVMVGPASFTLNDPAGLLVDGFDSPPMVMMTYNPQYYERLIEKAGFDKVQDLWAYRLEATAEPPEEILGFAASAERRFRFRTIRMREFEAELLRFRRVYNEAWERNWGFCPLTDAEIRDHAKQLRPLIDPRLVIIAEADEEPVAVGLTLPNVNEALIGLRGRMGPAAAAGLLWRARRRRWTSCRVVALGVRKAYRETGVGAHLYLSTLDAARRGGYRWGEMSWILESNTAMNAGIRHMGGRVYKTYRMFGRDVA